MFVDGSITGVPTIPISGVRSVVLTSLLDTQVSPDSSKLLDQYVWHGEASASKAYTVSCSVAAMTMLCVPPPIAAFATHRGCAYAEASIAQAKRLPNVAAFTVAVLRAYS